MESEDYDFAGQILFNDQGQPVPVLTRTWTLNQQEITYTKDGLLFFEPKITRKGKEKQDNIVFQVWESPQNGSAGVNCYSGDIRKAKKMIERLETFTKGHNCLRGAKLRDISMATAQFREVETNSKYTWEKYYFPKQVRDMFALEVFGFLKNTKRYNALGITKRGVLLYGKPGTGKTTIGHIICNMAKDSTVIWITPELIAENNVGRMSIKLLYMLTDFVSPAVIVLEDLDLFSEDREGVVDQLRLGALMNVLDGVNSVTNAVTVATTNRLNLVEKALSNRPGRFDSVVEIPPLTPILRSKMFKDRLSGCEIKDGVIEHLVKHSDDWTGAETQEFINRLNLYFINKNQEDNRVVTIDVVNEVLEIMSALCLQSKDKPLKGFA